MEGAWEAYQEEEMVRMGDEPTWPPCTVCEEEACTFVHAWGDSSYGKEVHARCYKHSVCSLCGKHLDRCDCDWGSWEDSSGYLEYVNAPVCEECDYAALPDGCAGGPCGGQID